MERVTQAEAARALGVNRSTVSRWVKKHPALADESGMVAITELRSHQVNTLNPGQQTKSAASPAADNAAPAPKAGEAATPVAPSLNDHRSRREQALADAAELDLAERLQKTLRRDHVDGAVVEAAEIMKSRAAQLTRDTAERLARIEDVREMQTELEEIIREIFAAGFDALTAAIDPEPEANAA